MVSASFGPVYLVLSLDGLIPVQNRECVPCVRSSTAWFCVIVLFWFDCLQSSEIKSFFNQPKLVLIWFSLFLSPPPRISTTCHVFESNPSVAYRSGKVPAHSSSGQHQHRRQEEGDVRSHLDQGYRSSFLESDLQEGRHRSGQACRWTVRGGDRENHNHHQQPKAIQDSRLVPEQTERSEGWQVLAGLLQLPRQQIPWGHGKIEGKESRCGFGVLLKLYSLF